MCKKESARAEGRDICVKRSPRAPGGGAICVKRRPRDAGQAEYVKTVC